ncbi:MAG TPA: VOC family protein [Pirellulales bacterium]|nr:VOC family protein [Pirellulales bacterium]
MPLALKGLHHVAVPTHRLEESRAFYRDLLGFREISRPPFNFGGAWLYNYGLQIHLIVAEKPGPEPGPILTRDHHLAFETPEIEAVERELTRRGIAFRVNIQAGTGLKQLFFHDPDGNHIEMASYGPTVG